MEAIAICSIQGRERKAGPSADCPCCADAAKRLAEKRLSAAIRRAISPNKKMASAVCAFPNFGGDRVASRLKDQAPHNRDHHAEEDDSGSVIGEGFVDRAESSGEAGHDEGWRDSDDQDRKGAGRQK